MEIWGVLEVDGETARRFDEDDQAFISTMANVLSLAMQRRLSSCGDLPVRASAAAPRRRTDQA